MKIKSLLTLFSVLFLLNFISCDDDLNSIGGSIQPPSDTISVTVDTVALSARTVSMHDSVYARTIYGVLGQYEDQLFGTIKSDYLCQFMFPDETKFISDVVSIDSVDFVIDFVSYLGDSLSPMGLTVYPVNKVLPEYFYTNIDPSKYADLDSVVTNGAYTIRGSDVVAGNLRKIKTKMNNSFGESLYEGMKNKTIYDKTSFNEFFPGLYVTTTSGTGSLINVAYTSIEIHYTHTYVDTLNVVRDTTALLSLSVTPEVIQLNHVKNKNPEELFAEGTGATYLKSPAGVYTEVVFPINKIAESMEDQNMSTINFAQFSVKGYTEKEDDSDFTLKQPKYLLLIPKDSVDSFFKKRHLPDSKITFATPHSSISNIYSFGNISPLITAYKDKGVTDITYVILPVQMEYSSDSYGTSTMVGVYNYMTPSAAVLRNDPANMRLELVYSKF